MTDIPSTPGAMPDPARLLAVLEARLAALAALEREVAGLWRDLHAFGGPGPVSGYAPDEWLALVGRLSGFDTRRLGQVTTRLPALPVTDRALWDGQLTLDQAGWIVDATRRLSGDVLREADERACALAVDVNTRGDDPDIRPQLDRLVRDLRDPASVERSEDHADDRQWLLFQPALDGGGRIISDLGPVGYATVVGAVEHAAGRPAPDVPRRRQRVAGLVALADRWAADPPEGKGTSRPSVTVTVDLADVTPQSGGVVVKQHRTRWLPTVTARTVETLACDGDLTVQITDGARPLARLRDRTRLPETTRRAVRTRDGGCRWPGCTAPSWQTDVHHLHEQDAGGDHDPDNLVSLCRRHHRRLHGAFWRAELDGRSGRLLLFRGRARRPSHTTMPHDRAEASRPDWTPTPVEVAAAAALDRPDSWHHDHHEESPDDLDGGGQPPGVPPPR